MVCLLSRVDGVAEAVPAGGHLPPHGTWAPLLSLPRLLGTALGSVPSGVPYLHPRADLARAWAGRLAAGSGHVARALEIGLVWAGNPAHAADALRSTMLAALAPLGRVPNVQFVALQKGEAGRQAFDCRSDRSEPVSRPARADAPGPRRARRARR